MIVNTEIMLCGLDCALANLGMAYASYDIATGTLTPKNIFLIKTERSHEKQIRRNSDDFQRAQTLANAMTQNEHHVDFWMAEIPQGAQSARAALAFGIAIGVIGSRTKPVIQVQPTESKKCVTGRRTASKDEMIQWAYKLYPDLPWLRARGKADAPLVDANEHLADALAIIHAGVATDEFKRAISLYRILR